MGQDAQLNLGVVRRHQHMSFFRNKRGSDLFAFRGADGDVLEIGLGAAQPPCGGDALVKRGVYPVGFRVNQQL